MGSSTPYIASHDSSCIHYEAKMYGTHSYCTHHALCIGADTSAERIGTEIGRGVAKRTLASRGLNNNNTEPPTKPQPTRRPAVRVAASSRLRIPTVWESFWGNSSAVQADEQQRGGNFKCADTIVAKGERASKEDALSLGYLQKQMVKKTVKRLAREKIEQDENLTDERRTQLLTGCQEEDTTATKEEKVLAIRQLVMSRKGTVNTISQKQALLHLEGLSADAVSVMYSSLVKEGFLVDKYADADEPDASQWFRKRCQQERVRKEAKDRQADELNTTHERKACRSCTMFSFW